jgi:peptidoglycan/xylan/chitin deacetylase (PgdA/CDA1 family)
MHDASSLDRALASSPLQGAALLASRSHLAVLAYHSVQEADPFERQLDYVQQHFSPVGLDPVIAALNGDQRLPSHAALITFDDGDRTVLDTAGPMLHERAIPAVMFVVSGVLDTETAFWWDEALHLAHAGGTVGGRRVPDDAQLLRNLKRAPDTDRLAALEDLRRTASTGGYRYPHLRSEELPIVEEMGIEVANHTSSHPCLPRCSRDKVVAEIKDAHDSLTSILGHPPRAFAYPNGDWDLRAEAVLGELGYGSAFLFDHRLTHPRKAHPLRLSRLRVNADGSSDRFRTIVSGLHPAIHRLRGRS